MRTKCSSHKRRFATFDDAVPAAIRVSRHLGPLRCYQCPECKGWHLTRRRTWVD